MLRKLSLNSAEVQEIIYGYAELHLLLSNYKASSLDHSKWRCHKPLHSRLTALDLVNIAAQRSFQTSAVLIASAPLLPENGPPGCI
jgi:hypothetical protein